MFLIRILTGVLVLVALWFSKAGAQSPQNGVDTPQVMEGSEEPAERGIRLDYGLNLGGYLASGVTANYYNGSGAYSGIGNQGTLAQILSSSNTYSYNRIRQDIGYDFSLHGLPMDMRYSPAMMIGLYASLQINPRVALMVESNFTRLKAEDQFTIKLERFSSIEGDNIERHLISGTEERIDVRLGIQYTFFRPESYVHPFMEFGFTATDTKAKTNTARIAGQTYSIHFPGTSRYFPERDFGLGLGAHGSLGLSMDVSEEFRFSFGYSLIYNKINLGNNQDFGFQHSIYVRLSLSHLFQSG